MKKISLFLAALLFSGCAIGPYHSSLKGYESGRYGGWATNKEAFELESQRITLEQYRKQSQGGQATTTGVEIAGLEGAVVNNSSHTIEFILTGPIKKVFFIDKRSIETHILPPGIYEARAFYRSQLRGWRTVNVNLLEEKFYHGKKFAWLLVFN
jgi:hypothetical protein